MKDGKKPKFPLPRGYFGDVRLTKEQEQYYREFCASQVQRGLLDEQLYHKQDRHLDPRKWKPIRSHQAFQVYRRADAGLYENDGKPSMLGLGRVEGTIEDVLYGAYDSSDDELRMTAELAEIDFGDGIVLSNIEQGSPADPYRYLGIKWILTPFPMPGVMVDRDWILLESMGISTDSTGKRYGYHTLFTVELPHCQPFPEVIRGTMWYTFIYRQVGKGIVDIHSQGYMDCYGDIIDFITIRGSNQMFNGVFRYIKSAESKKLTILALENLETKIAKGELVQVEKYIPQNATCTICDKTKSTNPFSSRRMRVCGICDAVVCLTCRVKKNILVGRQRVPNKVSVCQQCIAHAKSMVVEPANEKYVISRELQVGSDPRSTTLSTSTSMAFQNMNMAASGKGGHYGYGRPGAGGDGVAGSGTTPSSGRYAWGGASHGGYDSQKGQQSFDGGSFTPHHQYQHHQYQQPVDLNAPLAVNEAPMRTASSIQEINENESQQQQLYQRMQHLQESAKRALEMTEANRKMMVDQSTGRRP